MENFEKINFDTFLDYYEFADANGTIIKVSNYSKWVDFTFRNNINRDIVTETVNKLPECKQLIINEGIHKGLYIYSWNMANPPSNYCYKYNS